MEYSLTIVFVLDFLDLGLLFIPGKDTQLFKKNNTNIVVTNFFLKQIILSNYYIIV
jgi:hypothetical protein